MRINVPLKEIKSVLPTWNPLSSPALSLDRLAIKRAHGWDVRISPKERNEFLRELADRAGLEQEGDVLKAQVG